ncbi:MAG: C39 family peptidase [Candidatus Saccharibacteria bacterium]|nr:C39 family peptidase [Candidatus Saccharibacteria bacterium]
MAPEPENIDSAGTITVSPKRISVSELPAMVTVKYVPKTGTVVQTTAPNGQVYPVNYPVVMGGGAQPGIVLPQQYVTGGENKTDPVDYTVPPYTVSSPTDPTLPTLKYGPTPEQMANFGFKGFFYDVDHHYFYAWWSQMGMRTGNFLRLQMGDHTAQTYYLDATPVTASFKLQNPDGNFPKGWITVTGLMPRLNPIAGQIDSLTYFCVSTSQKSPVEMTITKTSPDPVFVGGDVKDAEFTVNVTEDANVTFNDGQAIVPVDGANQSPYKFSKGDSRKFKVTGLVPGSTKISALATNDTSNANASVTINAYRLKVSEPDKLSIPSEENSKTTAEIGIDGWEMITDETQKTDFQNYFNTRVFTATIYDKDNKEVPGFVFSPAGENITLPIDTVKFKQPLEIRRTTQAPLENGPFKLRLAVSEAKPLATVDATQDFPVTIKASEMTVKTSLGICPITNSKPISLIPGVESAHAQDLAPSQSQPQGIKSPSLPSGCDPSVQYVPARLTEFLKSIQDQTGQFTKKAFLQVEFPFFTLNDVGSEVHFTIGAGPVTLTDQQLESLPDNVSAVASILEAKVAGEAINIQYQNGRLIVSKKIDEGDVGQHRTLDVFMQLVADGGTKIDLESVIEVLNKDGEVVSSASKVDQRLVPDLKKTELVLLDKSGAETKVAMVGEELTVAARFEKQHVDGLTTALTVSKEMDKAVISVESACKKATNEDGSVTITCDTNKLVGGKEAAAGQLAPILTLKADEPIVETKQDEKLQGTIALNTITKEPETTLSLKAPEKNVDQIIKISISATGFHGKSIPGAFADVIDSSTYGKSDIKPKSVLVSCEGDNAELNMDQHMLSSDGKLGVASEKTCMKVVGEVRTVLAYKNAEDNLTFLTAGFGEGDILHGVFQPVKVASKNDQGGTTIELVKDSTGNFPLVIDLQGKTLDAKDRWAFPTGSDEQKDWREQLIMGSVIWRNMYQAKQKLIDFGGPPKSAILNVKFLPAGFLTISRMVGSNLEIGQSVWKARKQAAYSPHTELHELGHWVLKQMGVETPEKAMAMIKVPDIGVQLDVPFYTQGPDNCVDVARYMIEDYFNIQDAKPTVFAENQKVCDAPRQGTAENINNNLRARHPAKGFDRYVDFRVGPNDPDFFTHIDKSLELGAPVLLHVESITGAVNHTVVIVGYDEKEQVYLINNSAAANNKAVGYLNSANVQLTRQGLKDVVHTEGDYLGYAAYDGPKLKGVGKSLNAQSVLFKDQNSLNLGYLNQDTQSSYVEGFASYLALELDQQLGITNQSDCKWCYRNESNDFLNNLNLIHPDFVTFDGRGATGNNTNGESWVIASLFRSLTHGIPTGENALGGTSVPYDRYWLKSTTLKQQAVKWLGVGVDGLIAKLGNTNTIGQLRDRLNRGDTVNLEKTDGGSIASTQLDLLLGLYGFFPNKKSAISERQWRLDAEDFGEGGKLGVSSHDISKTISIRKYDYTDPAKSQKQISAYAPVPSAFFTESLGTLKTVGVMERSSSPLDFIGLLPEYPARNQPEEEPGSQLLVRSSESELTMLVNVIINEPASDQSFSFEQLVTPGKPITLQLPYQTYGTTAVIRFKDSADWLTIDSDQYWQLIGSETPLAILAEKMVSLGGNMPSVDSVLAAAGYARDGRRLPPAEPQLTAGGSSTIPIQFVVADPAPASPSVVNTPKATLVTTVISETGAQIVTSAASNKVEPDSVVILAVEGLKGKTAVIAIDSATVTTTPIVGDAQQLRVLVPKESGQHVITISDETGAKLDVSVEVAAASTNVKSWIALGFGTLLAIVLLGWYFVRHRRLILPVDPL